ncbi:MAG: phosphoribosylformylglycinamidine synthase subunit PurL [Trueperaceae bacterium]|nr:phosphoribosylformylglycinamidine synthase subunit PurL [Trueperaceae bacterium]
MRYARIEVTPDPLVSATSLRQTAHEVGITALDDLHHHKLFFVAHPDLSDDDVDTLCREVLSDPVIETVTWRWRDTAEALRDADDRVEVQVLPGVTDRTAAEVRRAAEQLGIDLTHSATGHRYDLVSPTPLHETTRHELAKRVLCNEVVERYRLGEDHPAFIGEADGDTSLVERFDLAGLDDDGLVALGQERQLALNIDELGVLRDFARHQGRALTDAELEMVAQTWSEHCYHKTFRAEISYREYDDAGELVRTETVDGLLKQYIRAATEACSKDWIVSAFVDNAGIIEFDDEFVVSFKAETHNHPSALEPFGGANTGVGGVIRDVIGVSAKPIAVTDVLCFGPQDLPFDALPEGTLHPRRVQAGVVAGVGDYGNKMGVPTVNGTVVYHPGYVANPLVYCGCVGLAPKNSHVTNPHIGDRIVVLGGLTGRDGLRGATFSSRDLGSESSGTDIASTAVQIGDPIVEKDVMEVILAARDQGLYNAITDCGAGGLSSAIGEMASGLGAHVELHNVGLKYAGLLPWEIWLSEAQERMVLSVSPDKLDQVRVLCEHYGVHCDVVGEMTGTGRMLVTYGGDPVVDLPMDLLHEGHPRMRLEAEWRPPREVSVKQVEDVPDLDASDLLLRFLADPNVASKEYIVRSYDHEVQGGTVVKPFTGAHNHGPSDAAVLRPLGTKGLRGIALGNGINPHYGELDPYAMALSAVDEAVRNVVAVGGDPDRLAILDNFCWGNPRLPDRLGSLVRAAQGCWAAATAFDLPFISGKDSLNNEYVAADGTRRPIPGTLLISALAIVPDVTLAVTMDAKAAGNLIYIVGETKNEFGGSLMMQHIGAGNAVVPGLAEGGVGVARALHRAITGQLVRACHDLSEGGLAVAAAEMAIAGALGLRIDPGKVPVSDDVSHPLEILFSESNGRWLVEVAPEQAGAFEAALSGYPVAQCGEVTEGGRLELSPIDLPIDRLDTAWQRFNRLNTPGGTL